LCNTLNSWRVAAAWLARTIEHVACSVGESLQLGVMQCSEIGESGSSGATLAQFHGMKAGQMWFVSHGSVAGSQNDDGHGNGSGLWHDRTSSREQGRAERG
jgi:hypothetical protein